MLSEKCASEVVSGTTNNYCQENQRDFDFSENLPQFPVEQPMNMELSGLFSENETVVPENDQLDVPINNEVVLLEAILPENEQLEVPINNEIVLLEPFVLENQQLQVPIIIDEIAMQAESNNDLNIDVDSVSDNDLSSEGGSLYTPSGQQSDSSTDSDESAGADIIVPLPNNNAESPTEVVAKKRRLRGQRNDNQHKRRKNAELRVLGMPYIGFEKKESGKYEQTIKRSAKKLGNRCGGHKEATRKTRGGPRQTFHCEQISDEDRNQIFTELWAKPSWVAKKTFVKENVLISKHKNIESRKKIGYRFYLTASDGKKGEEKRRVCKQMFMNTLMIGEKQLRAWVIGSKEKPPEKLNTPSPDLDTTTYSEGEPSSSVAVNKPARIKKDKRIDKPIPGVQNLREWLNSLAKVESHYCRSSTDRLYLEPVWDSVRHLYRNYSIQCDSRGITKVSRTILINEMRKMNISLYRPKKDQCNECTMFKNGTLENETYQKHISKKEQANAEKEADKSLAIDNKEEIKSYTVDLQAVLLAPRLNAASNYYKTKLKVHNQVYYDQATKNVSCYVWHEGSGGLESDIFATIATNFISNELKLAPAVPKKIIIWSDGCGYQNRNVKLSNALLKLSMEHDVIIEQKYLEVGHTHMEVDACHSAIENKLKRRKEVFLPADYVPIIQSARINHPYKTHYLSYNDFYKFDSDYYTSIRPGIKKGDPCVNDVVAFQYTPNKEINFKLSFGDNWQALPTRSKRFVENNSSTKLYNGPCPIEKTKFEHLQELKLLIPEDYREFYDKLIFKNEEKKKKKQ